MTQRMNFEILYKSVEDIKNDIKKLSETFVPMTYTRVFHYESDTDCTLEYLKCNESGSCEMPELQQCYLKIEGSDLFSIISLKEYRSAYRKYFSSRLKSTYFDLGKRLHDNQIHCEVEFIRGKVPIVLAKFYIDEAVKVTGEIVEKMLSFLKEILPNSANCANGGQPTKVTPAKISSKHSEFLFPFKKCFPNVLGFTESKKFLDFIGLDKDWYKISTYHWLRTKTGLVLATLRNGEYRNTLTNNVIDDTFIKESFPAITHELMLYMIKDEMDLYDGSEFKTVDDTYKFILGYGNVFDEGNIGIASFEYTESFLNKLKDRFVSFYVRRTKYIEYYEEQRAIKRNLANIGQNNE